MANLMDYLTILAGMYGHYRGGREERGTRRYEADIYKDVELGKSEDIKEASLAETESERMGYYWDMIARTVPEIAKASSAGDVAKAQGLTQQAVAGIEAIGLINPEKMRQAAGMFVTKIEQEGGQASLGMLNTIAGNLQQGQGQITERLQGQVLPVARDVIARQMGLPPQGTGATPAMQGVGGVPSSGGLPGQAMPAAGAPAAGPLQQSMAWPPSDDPVRKQLLSLYQQATVNFPPGTPQMAEADRLFNLFVRNGVTQNPEMALQAFQALLQGKSPAITPTPEPATAAEMPSITTFDVNSMLGEADKYQLPLPGIQKYDAGPDYPGLVRDTVNALPAYTPYSPTATGRAAIPPVMAQQLAAAPQAAAPQAAAQSRPMGAYTPPAPPPPHDVSNTLSNVDRANETYEEWAARTYGPNRYITPQPVAPHIPQTRFLRTKLRGRGYAGNPEAEARVKNRVVGRNQIREALGRTKAVRLPRLEIPPEIGAAILQQLSGSRPGMNEPPYNVPEMPPQNLSDMQRRLMEEDARRVRGYAGQ